MFSIVIPLFNKQKYIYETIDSVLKQSFHHFEIIIVNDGSTDNSINVVNSFADKRIKIFTIQNGGVSNARNIGIQYAQFEWIALLDADDLWEMNYLSEAVNIIESNNKIDVIATNYYLYNGIKKIMALTLNTGFVRSYFKTPCITSSTVIINKRVFDIAGYFNTNLKFGEDQHLWFRIASKCSIFFNNNPLVTYKLLDHSSSNKDFINRDLNSDLVSVINELEIEGSDWILFKERYMLKYLRPYYVCDRHLESVIKIIRTIKITNKNILLISFYLFPRLIIKPFYRLLFSIKYTN